ncbi:TPA: hypothetical protein PVK60_000555 [Acinetobacter baumannii]|uniref:hypothetical protein n=1 Tax=Acinetobacter baumannii TaxID=470 RepID=UPI001902B2EF|nr:hypothetical protein [Acinetobacter baumannii]MBJ9388238.1 hypothetical protein [Acinetobacter baumannii]MBJ9432296.1 hypothetical protein [Acinetobacter baumannii]HDI1577324.1 hypothetical protein [Acinetobacter baumannii]HDK8957554.1 hypothetical protein [Acinetobacter baumannii]
MDNYKINIKNGLDISKVTVALNDLGYVLGNLPKDDIHVIYAMADKTVRYVTYDDGYDYHGIEAKDLTVDQLKDKAVLHRNNPNDGNYSLFISEPQGHLNLYKTSEDVFYVFCNRLKIWDKSRAVNINTEGLVKKGEEKDPALISGADALRALADGKDVEYFDKLNKEWDADTSILPINVFTNGSIQFRLKPQTIKLELELPKPFEPKVGEEFWTIVNGSDGYACSNEIASRANTFGAWRTEEEIKQVVEQLRKIRGTNS